MKAIFTLILLFYSYVSLAQAYTINDYVGAWKYENNDTVFTVVLIEGCINNGRSKSSIFEWQVFGGYSMVIAGKEIDNYTYINSVFDKKKGYNPSLQQIYIYGSVLKDYSNYCSFIFYDQRKKHFNGTGISGGSLTLLTPNKLKWEIDEEAGIWFEIEGCEDCPEVSPIGFSVPNNVVLTKVLQ